MLKLPVITVGLVLLALGLYQHKPLLRVFGIIWTALGLFVFKSDFGMAKGPKRPNDTADMGDYSTKR